MLFQYVYVYTYFYIRLPPATVWLSFVRVFGVQLLPGQLFSGSLLACLWPELAESIILDSQTVVVVVVGRLEKVIH